MQSANGAAGAPEGCAHGDGLGFLEPVLDAAEALVVVCDREGCIRRFNPVAQRCTGYTAAEVIGRRLCDFLLAGAEGHAAKAAWDSFPADHFPHQHQTMLQAKNGAPRLIAWSDTAVRTGSGVVEYVVSTGVEITETRQTEAQGARLSAQTMVERAVAQEYARVLRQERDTLQAMADNTRAQVAYLDSQLRFVRVNRSYEQGCGHCQAELLGRNHFDLFPDPKNEAIFRSVLDTGQAVEFRAKPFEFPDDPERGVTYWDWTLAPVEDGAGRPQGLCSRWKT